MPTSVLQLDVKRVTAWSKRVATGEGAVAGGRHAGGQAGRAERPAGLMDGRRKGPVRVGIVADGEAPTLRGCSILAGVGC